MDTALEKRLQALEDRQAVEQVITDYLIAIDDRASVDAVMNLFTDDAVFDMSGIGYPNITGAPAIREFFDGVFAGMRHHAHYATNFSLDTLQGDLAQCRTHVIGMGVTADGDEVLFYLQYHLEMRRESGIWKINTFRGKPLMPIAQETTT
ncbi:MAG: nuclear transport factor 2 family protein [Chromatocurvus sp.]